MSRAATAALLLGGGSALLAGTLDFRAVPLDTRRLSAAVGDLDGDGWVEPVGAWNDGQGHLRPADLDQAGLRSLFRSGRNHRDLRVADLNGDGRPDVISNTYSCVTEAEPPALLFFNNGDRTFSEQPAFRALDIKGRGETIVVADFDDDGDTDVFIPFYTFDDPACPNAPQNYLLRNDGAGGFTDVSEAAGVALPGWPATLRPEGAQAVDFDGDGRLDLFVASHLFLNQGGMTFTDAREAYGLPLAFDEGAKFLDWNDDGRLDLVLHHPFTGPRLFEFDGTRFHERSVATDGSGRPFFSSGAPFYAALDYLDSYGVNVHDLDRDGREDLLVAGGVDCRSAVLLNRPSGFERAAADGVRALKGCMSGWGAPTPADVNRDGRVDVVYPREVGLTYYANVSSPDRRTLTVDVLGAGGRRNQHGRLVRITNRLAPGTVLTRVVDGGSGLLSQTPYTLQVASPWRGPHTVTAYFAARRVTFRMRPGQHAEVHADGTVRLGPQPAPAAVPPPPPAVAPGVYRPREGAFHLGDAVAAFGVAGDVPLTGDWDGDGVTTLGIYRPGDATFHLRNRNSAGPADVVLRFERAGGLPVVGDWNGDGGEEVGLFVPADGLFHLLNRNAEAGGTRAVAFGAPGDVPVVGDWDGNGTTTVGVYRPGEGRFLLRNCNGPGGPDLDFAFGQPGDLPVKADFDRDGVETVGVYRPSTSAFLLRHRNEAGPPDVTLPYGAAGDWPLLGTW